MTIPFNKLPWPKIYKDIFCVFALTSDRAKLTQIGHDFRYQDVQIIKLSKNDNTPLNYNSLSE